MWTEDLQARADRLRAAQDRAGVTTDHGRSTMRAEREVAATAAGVLAKQRERVLGVMDALVQHIGFIRTCDLMPEEQEALTFAKRFLAARRLKEGEA